MLSRTIDRSFSIGVDQRLSVRKLGEKKAGRNAHRRDASRHVTSRHVTNGSAGTNLASGVPRVAPYDRDKSTTDPASRNSRTRESKSPVRSPVFLRSGVRRSPIQGISSLAARNWPEGRPDTKRPPRGKVGRHSRGFFSPRWAQETALAESAPIIDRRYRARIIIIAESERTSTRARCFLLVRTENLWTPGLEKRNQTEGMFRSNFYRASFERA